MRPRVLHSSGCHAGMADAHTGTAPFFGDEFTFYVLDRYAIQG